ncbi:replication initiator protein [Chicken microvirus mg4_164]|nr:replication initiator protein [Chicken microvirus mg4_164]
MCLFPKANLNMNSVAYKKGVTEFECGCCPECLAKRARYWALRAAYEAKEGPACMVTLTYDQYVRDGAGRIVGEALADRSVDKYDCQLFIKRLRKHFGNTKIKYIITAEYGSRTHRPHYHAILFGVAWPDLVFYKKSKRGSVIYRSGTLEKLWHNGICTVDAVSITAKVARYCTKYCAKDGRCDDTFMLFSRGVGEVGLLEDFNGRSYIIDGREYPVPRTIWEKYITKNYPSEERSTWYFSLRDLGGDFELFDFWNKMRQNYRDFRDSLPLYQSYLAYWREKAERYERSRPGVFERVLALPDDKYFGYKQQALLKLNGKRITTPRASARVMMNELRRHYIEVFHTLPFPPCHETADDTVEHGGIKFYRFSLKKVQKNCPFALDFSLEVCYSIVNIPRRYIQDGIFRPSPSAH